MTNSTIEEIYSFDTFGPSQPGKFDFTPLFQDTLLSIVPSTILLFSIAARLWVLRNQPRKVIKNSLHGSKLLLLAVFAAIQMVLLILQVLHQRFRTRAATAASALALVDSLGLSLLSQREHIRSVRPSPIINVYLLLTILFDIVRARTLWLDGTTRPIASVFTSGLSVKLMILVAEGMGKRSILLERYQHSSPEVTSGVYSRSFFWWLNTLMTTGFQRVISNQDLYPIEEDMSSKTLHQHAQHDWNNSRRSHSRALFWSILKSNRFAFASPIFPRLCSIAFKYVQPLLLTRTVHFASSMKDPDSIGWGLTGAFGLVFLGLAIANGTYYHMTYRFVAATRGTLVSLIYFKTVDLSITTLDDSIAVTLMSSDTETICKGFQNLHELWAVPVELGIAMFLLYRELGLAFLAPAASVIMATVGIIAIAGYMGAAQKAWIQAIQVRVANTAVMLASMKGVKMLGFTDKMTEIIQRLRRNEIQLSSMFRKLLWIRAVLGNSTSALAPLMTFIFFVVSTKYSGKTLDTAAAFATLSLISLLASPINILIQTIPEMNSAMACLDRTQAFLRSDARKDHRLHLSNPTSEAGHIRTHSDEFELENLTSQGHDKNENAVMTVQEASFSWGLDSSPVVADISFTISQGQFSFVIGPVGSGKSTLLKGLLGETPSSQGFVYTKHKIAAFVDQTPWIQNGTIQQNILGLSNFDETWYRKVVFACALEHDISIMPKGSATQVGSGGISLSGGQKQRVAIARALYAKTDLIILDDVFSGLDADTEEQIFSRLFSSHGLFRQMHTTVILATHAVSRLSYSDQIIALDNAGRIAQQGSFQKLKLSQGYVQGLETRLKKEGPDDEIQEESTIVPITSREFLLNEDTAQTEELHRQTGDFQVYKYYFTSIGWFHFAIFISLCVLEGTSVKFTEFLLIYWTRAVTASGNEANNFFLGMFGLISGIAFFGLICCAGHFFMLVIPTTAWFMHEKLLDTVMAAPLSFFSTTDTGTTTNRFSQDLAIIDTELPHSLVDLMVQIVRCINSAALMCLSASYFLATMPAVILSVWILQKFYLRTSRQMRLLDLEAKSPLYSHFLESLNGLVTIRAFGWAESFQEINLDLLDTSQKPYYLMFCIQRWLALILDLLVTAMAIILMILIVKLRSKISPGHVGLAILNVMNFSELLADIVKEWTSLETSLGAIARIKSFSETTANENVTSEIQPVPADWPKEGAIEFKNVSASYKADSNLVIKNLNLSIKPGEKLGICGRSGSGKSSLLTALFRMLELTPESSIIIDGIDITTIPRQVVRSRLNAIPQEPLFLKGTIRFNLDPHNSHTDEVIISAITRIKLWSVVLSKNSSLNTELEPDFFSHGQRQLFCLARAILRKSKVVVLDEVTSSVDGESDALMQRVIREEFADCTIICVAHRLDTILDFDRVALLNAGVLVECDNPRTLLERESRFRELYYS